MPVLAQTTLLLAASNVFPMLAVPRSRAPLKVDDLWVALRRIGAVHFKLPRARSARSR